MSRTKTTGILSAAIFALLTAEVLSGCHKPVTPRPLPVTAPLAGTVHPSYSIVDFGPGQPSHINNKGQVVGMFPTETVPHGKGAVYFHGFSWKHEKRTELEPLAGRFCFADAVTDQGLVTGASTVLGRTPQGMDLYHRCVWHGGKATDVEKDPRFRGAEQLHLTKSGALYVVRRLSAPPEQQHLWLYPAGLGPGTGHDLGAIGTGHIFIYDINDSGTVVGSRSLNSKDTVRHAFVWHQGRLTDLGTLGGANSEAVAVNNAGQVTGDADLAKNADAYETTAHAFLWEQGRMHDLGLLPSCHVTHAYAINSAGEVIGYAVHLPTPGRPYLASEPVLWKRGQIIALSSLIPAGTPWQELAEADDINNAGAIAGSGHITGDHHAHGFLLTPIVYKAGTGDVL